MRCVRDCALTIAVCLVGCSATPNGPSPGVAEGGSDAPSSAAVEGGTCAGYVETASAELPCTTDADCVKTFAGGNTCDPCSNPVFFTCATDPINTSSRAAYEASLAQALGRAPGPTFAGDVCGHAVSCPDMAIHCALGQCAFQ